jgi:hypothetical protein
MYVMPDSTASGMTPEPAQLDFSHGLHRLRSPAMMGCDRQVLLLPSELQVRFM